MDPEHYFCLCQAEGYGRKSHGCYPCGDGVKIVKEKYNSKWAQVLWRKSIAYMQRKDLNFADAYLAGAGNGNQQYIKLAKKKRLLTVGF